MVNTAFPASDPAKVKIVEAAPVKEAPTRVEEKPQAAPVAPTKSAAKEAPKKTAAPAKPAEMSEIAKAMMAAANPQAAKAAEQEPAKPVP